MKRYYVSLALPLAMSIDAHSEEAAKVLAIQRVQGWWRRIPDWPGIANAEAEILKVTEVPTVDVG